MPPRVALQSIVKAFAGVVALKGVDLEVRPGEIHALCGENGAGKSTLMNILGGVIRPDRGSITIDGVALDFRGPIDALRNGVALIHQELSLVNSLTVAENLMLGHESHIGPWIRRRAMVREAQHLLDRLDFPIDPTSRVADLAIGTRQLVEIAKALGRSARVVVLDEPTAALTRAEVDRLFHTLADLKKQQIAIVYISHHLDEVAQIADRVTVLRDGQKVGTWMASELSTEQLIQEMLGQDVKIAPKIERASLQSQPCWVVRDAHGKSLQGVDLTIHQGEVVGLTGLAGAGHDELAAIAFGAERLQHGQMSLLGKPYAPGHPGQAMTLGVASVPGDRRRQGLIPTLDIADNLTLTLLERFCLGPFLNRRRLRTSAAQWCDEFEVARASLSQRVITLSGGNQQKVLLARWVSREPRFLIVNEPTRGIDVKTREAIHRRLELLSQQGLGILLVTSDTQELVRMADRVVVVRDGRVAGEIARNAMTEGAIVAAMMGAAS